MKYWSGTDVAEHDRREGEDRIVRGFPASRGATLTVSDKIWGYYELEIVPNSWRWGLYLNPATFNREYTHLVDVEIRIRRKDALVWQEETYAIPIADFGLKDIPVSRNTFDAYDRAMRGI